MKRLRTERLKERIEARAAEDLASGRICGASVLVAQEGEPLFHACFGVASPEDGRPMHREAVFRLASMTKPITAAATVLLAERGQLALDDPIARYLPCFENMEVADGAGGRTPLDRPVTVRQLLTHTSGIGSGTVWNDAVRRMCDADRESVEHFVRFLSGEPLSFVPGTKQEYSGVGAFSVLTEILQRVSGMELEELLQKEIFGPCGMKDTTFCPTEAVRARMVAMHTRHADGTVGVDPMTEGCVFENFPARNYLGGAGLVSTVEDYARFAGMLLDGGVCEGRRILSSDAVREMTAPQLSEKVHPGKQRWGLAVRVITSTEYGTLPVGAYGWSGAYGTHFWVDPENRVVAIYMKNSRYDGGSGARTAANFEADVYAATE